jgi:hypothetical protein
VPTDELFPGHLTAEETQVILRAGVHAAQQRFQSLIVPYHELGRIEMHRRPAPMMHPSGLVFEYIGPTLTEISGPYRAPDWIRQLLEGDATLRHELALFRRHMEPDYNQPVASPDAAGTSRGG